MLSWGSTEFDGMLLPVASVPSRELSDGTDDGTMNGIVDGGAMVGMELVVGILYFGSLMRSDKPTVPIGSGDEVGGVELDVLVGRDEVDLVGMTDGA